MPKYDRKEFAKECWPNLDQKKALNKLRVYISRQKVIEKNKLIDTANEINAQFLEKEKELSAEGGGVPNQNAKKSKGSPITKPTKPEKEPVTVTDSNQDKDIDEKPEVEEEPEPDLSDRGDKLFTQEELQSGSTLYIDKAKRIAEVMRIQNQAELQQIQKDRLAGKVIPTDMVKEIFAQHFKNVTDEFYQSVDNLVTTISARLGSTREEMVRMRADLKSDINTAVHLAKKQSEKDIINIVETYSESIRKKS